MYRSGYYALKGGGDYFHLYSLFDMYILITGCTINGTSPAEYFNTLSINTKLYENIIYLYRINYINENNHHPPLAHNTLSDTPTTQRLTFRLIELKIFISIKSAPPLAYQTNCTLTLRMCPLRTRE